MRTLALFLILANVAFFTWQLGLLTWFPWQPAHMAQTTDTIQVSSQPQVSQLLLNERDPLPQPEHLTINTSPVFSPENESSALISKNDLLAGSGNLSDSVTKSTPSKLQQVAGVPLTPPVVAPNVQNHGSSSFKSSSQAQNLSVTCYQAGPFAKQAIVKKMVRWLNQQKNVTTSQQTKETKKLNYTRVYLPPFESRAEAKKVVQRLRSQGVTDYLIINQGHLSNGIALGSFSKSSNVEARIKDLKTKGYQNIKTQAYYKNETEYWLNVKMLKNQQMLKVFSKKFQAAQLLPIHCQGAGKSLE